MSKRMTSNASNRAWADELDRLGIFATEAEYRELLERAPIGSPDAKKLRQRLDDASSCNAGDNAPPLLRGTHACQTAA